jgi:signal peptidase I
MLLFIKKWYKNNQKFILFIVLMTVFRSAVADWYTVPTGSMQPTIKEGDRIVVNKMAYDIKLPFSQLTLVNLNKPKHGEIIVFESKSADMRLIKRVIGLPGDTVTMKDEQLYLNGQAIHYQTITNNQQSILSSETLGGITHKIQIDNSASDRLANFGPVIVPKAHYLVLGDNRRHSADSRVYGFVPHKELQGKATAVAFSVNYDNYYLPRSERFLQDIYQL